MGRVRGVGTWYGGKRRGGSRGGKGEKGERGRSAAKWEMGGASTAATAVGLGQGAGLGTTERQTFNGARRFTAGTEGRAAKLGSYGGLQRAREVACKVPDAWQSMWVDDSTAEAHARARSAGKRARRGEQGLAAPVARGFRLLRLHRRKAHRGALCGQAGGPLSREMTRGRSMPGQRVVVRFIVPEQIVWDSVGVRSSVATHRTPRKVRRGAGKPQTRPAGAVGAGCRGISDLVI